MFVDKTSRTAEAAGRGKRIGSEHLEVLREASDVLRSSLEGEGSARACKHLCPVMTFCPCGELLGRR
ncbi:hypothetical protein ACFPRL_34920 [Pseudoclavibacter helvolus]